MQTTKTKYQQTQNKNTTHKNNTQTAGKANEQQTNKKPTTNTINKQWRYNRFRREKTDVLFNHPGLNLIKWGLCTLPESCRCAFGERL